MALPVFEVESYDEGDCEEEYERKIRISRLTIAPVGTDFGGFPLMSMPVK